MVTITLHLIRQNQSSVALAIFKFYIMFCLVEHFID